MNDIIVRTGKIPEIDVASRMGWGEMASGRPSRTRDEVIIKHFLPPPTPGYEPVKVEVDRMFLERCFVWVMTERRITHPVPDPTRPRRKIIRPLA